MKLFSFIILFISTICFGQNRLEGVYDSKHKIFRFSNGDTSFQFSNGVAFYKKPNEESMGLIDTTGRIIVYTKYWEVEDPFKGLSLVTVKSEPWKLTYGFIDTLGNEILPSIFDDADTWFYRSMRLIDVLVVGKDNNYGIFNYKGKQLAPLIYQSIGDFHFGFAKVSKGGKMGFLNKYGKEIIPSIYEEVNDFNSDLALVRQGGKYGWIDTIGRVIIPFEYDWASDFIGKLSKVKKDGKMFFIDRKGNTQISTEFEGVSNYSFGLASVHNEGKWGFIDSSGKVKIPLIYNKAGNFVRGRACVRLGDKWGHIDTCGKITTLIIYEKASDFSGSYNGDSTFASVMLNGKYGKVGLNGNLVIPCNYIGIDHFSMGLAKVKKQIGESQKFGFVNYNGQEIIPCIYDKAELFRDGRKVAIVCFNGEYGLINLSGEKVTAFKYSSITDLKDGTYQVYLKNETYIIDQYGKRIK